MDQISHHIIYIYIYQTEWLNHCAPKEGLQSLHVISLAVAKKAQIH